MSNGRIVGGKQGESTTVSVSAKLHETSMAVWDVPSPIVTEARVRAKIGLKCRQGCNLGGHEIYVRDARGAKVAAANLTPSPLQGTGALYWAEVEFFAPRMEGIMEWNAYFDGDQKTGHAAASFKFGLMVTGAAPHKLTIRVLDSSTKLPLDNAYVRIGPYTFFSDEAGVVRASVPDANYEFVTWKRNHRMHRSRVSLDRNYDLTVELTPQPCKYCPDST